MTTRHSLPWSVDHSPSTRRVCSIRISSAHVGGALLAFEGHGGIELALSPSNERLELLMKRGDWRQAADQFRLLPDCVPCGLGEVFPLKNDGGPEILEGGIIALLSGQNVWCHIRHSGILFHRPEYAPSKPVHLDHQNSN